jgi:drug/metabolite transporter (DMT)-like permease
MTSGNPVHKEQRRAGQAAILLCAVLWSTSGLFIKLVDWHPVLIAGSRSVLAAGFLLVLRRFATRDAAPFPGIPRLALLGLPYAATMILFVIANKLTAPANAILLQYTAPVWAALLGWLVLGERPHWGQWAALALVSAGMFLVFRNSLASGSASGDILALVSGLAFGANSVILRAQKDVNAADCMLSAHLITVLVSIPFCTQPPALNAGSLCAIVFMGIVQIGTASALFAYGIKRIPAVQAMLTAAIEPVLNPVWVLLVTGERPAMPVIAGGSVIIGAIALSSLAGKRRIRHAKRN